MRYINEMFAPKLGERWDNQRLLATFEPIIDELPMDDEARDKLRAFVRFQLVGERSRYTLISHWRDLDDFRSRASEFDRCANLAIDALAEQIAPKAEAAGVTFDALITTTATGNLMPGLSYRLAHRMGDYLRTDTMMIDLANVGCTGSSKALNLVRSLDASVKNILVVAVEIPATLVDVQGTALDLWQGNCTFGDGAAALWITSDPERGSMALALEDLHYRQRADVGLDLIRWGYRNYYTFALADEKTFEKDVRQHVIDALSETEAGWKDEPRWAIHPAGIALLVRISRKLGIPSESIQSSVAHYREHSNMSSVSVLQVLKQVAEDTPVGSAINLLTMGAGFNVVYGRVRRAR